MQPPDPGAGAHRLLLDLHLIYAPPMADPGLGIVLTTEIALPFPPFDGLAVFGASLDPCPGPVGLPLRDVRYDIDRRVFIADTTAICHGEPLSGIRADLRSRLDLGWRWGSYHDGYDTGCEPTAADLKADAARARQRERAATRFRKAPRPAQRSSADHRLFCALIRMMSERINNEDVAYAMHKTGIIDESWPPLFGEAPPDTPFANAVREFRNCSERKREAWRAFVESYPRLEECI